MTTYSSTYFDRTPGTIEQLIYIVLAQKLANQEYVPLALETEFTRNAIDWNVTGDFLEGGSNCELEINILLPVSDYDPTALLSTSVDLSQRVYSLNSTNIDTLYLLADQQLEDKSFAAKFPPYLLDFASNNAIVNNTLERRLCNLCFQILGYKRWEQRYNYVVNTINQLQRAIDFNATSATEQIPLPNNIDIDTLEGMRQTLIAELASADALSLAFPESVILTYDPQFDLGTEESNGGSATAMGDALGGTDPASQPNLSESLKDLLNNAGNAFGAASDLPASGQQEVPTLKDC